jgi:hypothetical protein
VKIKKYKQYFQGGIINFRNLFVMPTGKNINKSPIEKLHKAIKELNVEIAKGWDGPASKRSVKDVVAAKRKAHKA